MQSIRIVETLDPIDQIKSRLCACRIPHSIDPLHLQRLEETLHRRIVPAVSLATHRLHHAVTIDQAPMLVARVLAYCTPRSEWMISPGGGLRRQYAMVRASHTDFAFMRSVSAIPRRGGWRDPRHRPG